MTEVIETHRPFHSDAAAASFSPDLAEMAETWNELQKAVVALTGELKGLLGSV